MMSFGIPFVGWLACMLPVQGTGAQFVPGAQGEATSYELFEGTAAVPSYTGAVELGLNASLIGCLAGQPSPWSGRYAPDGNHVYVTLFGGGLGGSNCLVAKLDAQTLAPVSTIQVGLAPEEIAFTTTTQGALEYGFVTNSTGSSVSVFNAADQVVATIPIPVQPGDPFGTAFPFGLAVAPDQSRVYVGTLDGSGNIYAINVATLALEPTETIAFGADHGFARLTFAGEILVVPITVYNPGFQGSTGEVAFLDPKSPGTLSEVVLATSPTASAFPNPIDVEVLGDQVYVCGFDMGPFVYELFAPTGQLVARIPTGTANRQGKLHALGSDGAGLLVAADLITGEVAFLDATARRRIGLFDTNSVSVFHSQLNDVVIAPDGARLFLPGLGSSTLAVFEHP